MTRKILLVLFLLLMAGCTYTDSVKSSAPGQLNVYNWEDYLGETTIHDFEEEAGIRVNLFTFADENLMESDVQSNPDKYDVIIASGALIQEMGELKLLAPLDHENMPNIRNIGSRFINPWYDPGNRYSVPYLWGTTGLLINTKYVPEDTYSWSALWNKSYAGKIGMLNNKEEVIAASLKRLGYSLNTGEPDKLEQAKASMLEQKPLIRGYEDPIIIRDAMINEELWLAQEYSGEAVFATSSNADLKYVIPEEGAAIWVDNLAIPRDARNKEAAEAFINFILRPDVSAEIANYLHYANTNEAAKQFTDKQILADRGLYPSKGVTDRLEGYHNASRLAAEYNKIWAAVQAG